MAGITLPDRIKRFLFLHIDSVEQLEILLFLSNDKSKSWTTLELSRELRSNPNSVQSRLVALQSIELVKTDGGSPAHYAFTPKEESVESLIQELREIYRTAPHKVFELLFSPMKKARDFADAFVLAAPKDTQKKDDDDA